MTENCDASINETNMDSENTFDNLTILKELGNIANLVKDDDFLEAVPKAKLKRVKWTPMFNCLKQGILNDMVSELNTMWQDEGMHQKIAVLDKQKEKYADSEQIAWRPKLDDVSSQLKSQDAANLLKEKQLLTALASEYDDKVNKLKTSIAARRGYLKKLQLDIQKYHKKNEDVLSKLNSKIERHGVVIDEMCEGREVDEPSVIL